MPISDLRAALEALTQALCLEVDGEDFYRQAATRTADPKGRQMYLELAGQEAWHQALIRRQIDSLTASGEWAPDAEIRGFTCDLSQSLFPQGAERAKAVGPRANELEALWFAIDKEAQSYELYRQAALQAQSAMAKALYQYLMSAEREHFDLLMGNYEAILREQYRADT